MRLLRVLVVDDEAPARALLRSLLQAEAHVAVVGEAEDGEEAVRLIRCASPDLVLLDVQLPELDGFEVIEAIGVDAMPAVVFVTAYDRHALRAFDVHALDYLVKPYSRDQLRRALERARAFCGHATSTGRRGRLLALLEELRPRAAQPARFAVRGDGRVLFLDVESIDWIEAAGKSLRLHVGKTTYSTPGALAAVERQLDRARFRRLHRSAIVNVRRIREVQPWFKKDFLLVLADGTRLRCGRAYRDEVRALLDDAVQPRNGGPPEVPSTRAGSGAD
jgi:two-component system LytT family response regulator